MLINLKHALPISADKGSGKVASERTYVDLAPAACTRHEPVVSRAMQFWVFSWQYIPIRCLYPEELPMSVRLEGHLDVGI